MATKPLATAQVGLSGTHLISTITNDGGPPPSSSH
jgi:hypothetical protein